MRVLALGSIQSLLHLRWHDGRRSKSQELVYVFARERGEGPLRPLVRVEQGLQASLLLGQQCLFLALRLAVEAHVLKLVRVRLLGGLPRGGELHEAGPVSRDCTAVSVDEHHLSTVTHAKGVAEELAAGSVRQRNGEPRHLSERVIEPVQGEVGGDEDYLEHVPELRVRRAQAIHEVRLHVHVEDLLLFGRGAKVECHHLAVDGRAACRAHLGAQEGVA
mmetsp:Transcript_18092/g.56697  ORF Transcript_18092/g.56697 Transcript_18092/m.56697 type:complete len:219 (+) Transcript_18092:2050-2706(+)